MATLPPSVLLWLMYCVLVLPSKDLVRVSSSYLIRNVRLCLDPRKFGARSVARSAFHRYKIRDEPHEQVATDGGA